MPGRRPRISEKVLKAEVVFDIAAFYSNKSSDNAKKVFEIIEKIKIDIWFDKHFYNREQFGDESGLREGIDRNTIRILVCNALRFLIHFNLKIKNFKFINYEDSLNTRKIRVVLQEKNNNFETLNVITEFHYLFNNSYEVTVITAMCSDDFRISEGQFILEVLEDGAILKQKLGSKLSFIDEIFWK
jgi:hypothetical protein